LQRALSELGDVTQALTTSRQEAQAAWEQIQTLTEINSRLSRELIELARREAQVRDFAYHDELTGLPNRRLLLDRLKQAVAQAARRHKQVVLLLLDLDGFKSVNDRLGHAGGDKLLQTVARRLTDGIRGADTACRYGGDEFLIMLPEVDNPGMATTVWGKLKLALGEPYIIDGYQVRLTTSMGGVLYPTDGQTDEELIRRADDALYRAKARSGNASIKALPREKLVEDDTRYGATPQRPGQSRNDDRESQREASGRSNPR
jgi:diguanylate cyclase (GGDEF)-like protein